MNNNWKSLRERPDLHDLENKLDKVLTPVFPREIFVLELHKKLMNASLTPGTGLVKMPALRFPGRRILIGVASSIGILLAILTSIRAVIGLIGAFGLLGKINKQFGERESAPSLQASN